MVLIDRVTAGGGDGGQTSLADGARVSKDDARIEALGAVDEANAAIGQTRVYTAGEEDDSLARIQNDLFELGAELATSGERPRMTPVQVLRLEAEIAAMNTELRPLTSSVLPGGAPGAAAAHMARMIVRRTERRVVTLARQEQVNPEMVRYLNRLSDHLFVLARRLSSEAGDVLWQPGATQE
jgi:cob(I)alamin adenosyltransferase